MEKRTINIALIVAAVSFVLSRIVLGKYSALEESVYAGTAAFIYPFFAALREPISSLSWFIPGMVVGLLCTKKPIKHGAVTGTIFGVAVGLITIVLTGSEVHGFDNKLSQLSFALILVVENLVLFSVSSAFGYQVRRSGLLFHKN